MDPKRLAVLVELSRLGSMRAVADVLHTSTSTVSQQIAALAQEAGAPLLEPAGRGVRLSPAGRRLAGHAVTILAAIDAARADLDPAAEPAGTVRVAAYASAARRALVPLIGELGAAHPRVRLVVHELEPGEAEDALLANRVDLALVYDYTLAPVAPPPGVRAEPLWRSDWGLAVPDRDAPPAGAPAPELIARFRDAAWIGNPRNPTEETALRVLTSLAGFEPRMEHHADTLELAEDLILTGTGVGLLPMDGPGRAGVTVLPLRDPAVTMRTSAWTKEGRPAWPPLAVVLAALHAAPAGD